MASIEKRSDTTYRITVSCGYDKQGKKLFKKKTVNIEPTLTERQKEKKLNELAVLFEKEVQSGTYLDGEQITFEEFANKWLTDYAEKHLAPGTLNSYSSRLKNRVIPALGHLKLAKIQPHHLLEFYNNLAEDGIRMDAYYKPTDILTALLQGATSSGVGMEIGISAKTFIRVRNGEKTRLDVAEKISQHFGKSIDELFSMEGKGKTLSSKTIKHHHDLISSVLSTAVEWNVILNNPAERVKKPRVSKIKPQYYDDTQVAELFMKLANAPLKYKTAIYLTIDTGLRLSELAGLEWRDIDFENNSITVERQRQYVNGSGTFTKHPKTENGYRNITVSETIMQLLKRYRTQQKADRLKMGNLWPNSNNLFIHEDGVPIHPHRPYTWFMNFLKQNNLPKITFHALRHTNASLLIAEDIDIVTLSGRLGHADKNVTLNTYSHIIKSKEKQAANKMENFYSRLLEKDISSVE